MQAVTVSVAPKVENVDISPLKLPDGGDAGNFQALLNIGIIKNDDPAPVDAPRKNQNGQDGVAAAIDAPQPIVSARQPRKSSLDAPEPTEPDPIRKSDITSTARDTQSTTNRSDQSNASSDDSSDVTDASGDNSSDNKLRSSLRNQLGSIDQILLSTIQSLSAQDGTTQAPAATDAVAAATTALPVQAAIIPVASAADVPAPTLDQQFTVQQGDAVTAEILPTIQITPPQAVIETDVADQITLPQFPIKEITTGPLPAQPANSNASNKIVALPLLKDIQSILKQIQQNLQMPEALPAQSSGVTDNLDALAQAMQKDVAQLSQLLSAQTSTGSDSQSVSLLVSTPVATSTDPIPQTTAGSVITVPTLPVETAQSTKDLALMLKSGITAIRDQLQKLKSDNESQFVQARADLQMQFLNAKQFFEGQSNSKDNSSDAAIAAISTTPAFISPVISSDQAATIPAPANTNQSLLIQAAIIDVAQSNSDNSSDANSGGNNQGQNASQPLMAASAAKTGGATASNSSSFSSMLDKAAGASVIDQVSFQVKTARGDGSSKISIQLDPIELGKVEIKLNVRADGKTDVVITADNRNTLNILQNDSQGLTRALNDAGLQTDGGSLNFNLRGGQQEQGQGGNAQAAITYQKTQPEEEEDVAINTIIKSYTVNLSEGLDISI